MIETLSLAEVCEALGCQRSKVFELLADGTLTRAPKYGRGVRIYAASVARALEPKKTRARTVYKPRVEITTKADCAEYLR